MTPQQKTEFETYGCVTRCILRFAEKIKMPIAQSDFLERYEKYYQQGNYGLLSLNEMCAILTDLKLCSHVDSTRLFSDVVESLKRGFPVFLSTCYDLDEGLSVKAQRRHARMIEGIESHPHHSYPSLYVWDSSKDVEEPRWIALNRIELEGGHYLICT
jgi:hypothetical protein